MSPERELTHKEKKITKAKYDVRNSLRKGGTTEEDFNKTLDQIPITETENPFVTLSAKNKPKLRTNTVLDDLLGVEGGITAGQLIEAFGGYGSGKTQTGFTMAAEASQDGTVLWIDSERTWKPERQTQICKERGLDIGKMEKNFIHWKPHDYKEQLTMICRKLPSPYDLEQQGRPPMKLIVVDSLITLVDDSMDFMGRQTLPARGRAIRNMLRSLRDFADDNNCAVYVTNQVSSIPDVTKFMKAYQKEQGLGGNVTRHKPDVVLYFRRTTDPLRIVRLMDSSELPTGERVFQINKRGIDDVAEKAAWMQKAENDKQYTVEAPEDEETKPEEVEEVGESESEE